MSDTLKTLLWVVIGYGGLVLVVAVVNSGSSMNRGPQSSSYEATPSIEVEPKGISHWSELQPTPTRWAPPEAPLAAPTLEYSPGHIIDPHEPDAWFYTVQPGDTLSALSKRFSVPVDQLMWLNRITDAKQLRAGQRIYFTEYDIIAAPPKWEPVSPSRGWTGYTCDRCIKGNVSYNMGERIYHIPGCESYDVTSIDPSYGERWFSSEAEAIAAGWRKAWNCP